MRRSISQLLGVSLICSGLAAGPAWAVETITIQVKKDQKIVVSNNTSAPFQGERAGVDVAILLDTSNSMDGLINQAKSQLWGIVQQFSHAKKHGQTPTLRVAVFEYGNTKLPASEGYIRQVVQLTDDLDKVSEALFSLSTSGGDEYCGQVIQEAVKRLDWTKEPNSYKAIFIAGNEPFTQGSVDYKKACQESIGQGIVVNTIHCGSYSAGVSGMWQAGAQLAEGKFLNINQDEKVVHIKCPQDVQILQLNTKLNKTYLWFGEAAQRRAYAENQIAQDANASKLSSGVLLSRAAAKGGASYNNAKRDLVDAFRADTDALAAIPEAKLPESLQEMTQEQRTKHVEKLSAERKEIQQQIAKLNRERFAYLAKQQQATGKDSKSNTLGDAFAEAVRSQLKEAGFELTQE